MFQVIEEEKLVQVLVPCPCFGLMCVCVADAVGAAARVSQYLDGAAVSHLCPISEAMLTCRHKRSVRVVSQTCLCHR